MALYMLSSSLVIEQSPCSFMHRKKIGQQHSVKQSYMAAPFYIILVFSKQVNLKSKKIKNFIENLSINIDCGLRCWYNECQTERE